MWKCAGQSRQRENPRVLGFRVGHRARVSSEALEGISSGSVSLGDFFRWKSTKRSREWHCLRLDRPAAQGLRTHSDPRPKSKQTGTVCKMRTARPLLVLGRVDSNNLNRTYQYFGLSLRRSRGAIQWMHFVWLLPW